ncbi:family D DNA polymerase small subunit [Candidatus Mancarchaeum acidiphilum]|uniref:DNA polymerase II small subunit n=1 Tax=Candidatus Mancarchaeum acidiphilum TaxID=1920749 RepID=A0A218NNP3_9ARCH|nr:DNA-directed DNA polymerase II small subunit [Candidatus Mancarchaeum acidiphilum]ASI14064.1 family D DNA polymerase small subunit [Candidatus Mancarchaeum acidiphilum]
MEDSRIKEFSERLSKVKMLPKSEINSEVIGNVDLDRLVDRLILDIGSFVGFHFVTLEEVTQAIGEINNAKIPMPVEVIKSSSFKPIASEYHEKFEIENRDVEHANGNVNDFVDYFRDRLHRIRRILETHVSTDGIPVGNLSLLKDMVGRDVYITGIVSSKITTKKGNIMVVMEDETDSVKVIFSNSPSEIGKRLYNEASTLVDDEVIAVKGKLINQFVIAKQIIWPDVTITERKNVEEDLGIAFISDVHVGSKLFLEQNFENMIKWLNGGAQDERSKEMAGKVKYLVVSGDVVDGIGVYPNQDRDLSVPDMYMQYQMFFDLIEDIPDYIHVFVLPGNHDSVRRAEPQPAFPSTIIKDYKKDNIHFVSNPSYLTLNGIQVLAYHGTSLDSIISSIPGMSYDKPEYPMLELLKRRHLSPIYGGNVIVPSKTDKLVIDKVPDILTMGHVHKNAISKYKGVTIINSGTWQARTAFQVKYGQIPTPARMPVFEMKTYKVTTVNFSSDSNVY